MFEEVGHVMSPRAILIISAAAWSGRGAAAQVFYAITIQSAVGTAVKLLKVTDLRA